MELMGHYDIDVTKNIYIDVQRKFEQEEIKKLEYLCLITKQK